MLVPGVCVKSRNLHFCVVQIPQVRWLVVWVCRTVISVCCVGWCCRWGLVLSKAVSLSSARLWTLLKNLVEAMYPLFRNMNTVNTWSFIYKCKTVCGWQVKMYNSFWALHVPGLHSTVILVMQKLTHCCKRPGLATVPEWLAHPG